MVQTDIQQWVKETNIKNTAVLNAVQEKTMVRQLDLT